MKKLLLDANFLVVPFQFNVDIFEEFDRLLDNEYHEIYTLGRTYNEAQDLDDGEYRNMVRRLVEESDIEVIQVDGEATVDEVLAAQAGEYIICTNDKEIRAQLRENGLPHIYLRGKHHLEGTHLERARFY